MFKPRNPETAAIKQASVGDRLARLLETPSLARLVPHLPPETLHQLIRTRGLDACAELVTSATPAQLTSILDLDLWRHAAPGRDEQFDVDRFGEWLEVLVDADSATAARTVAALDPNLVMAGLARYVRVLDPGIFEPVSQSDDERMDRRDAMREGGDGVECELGGYVVRARRTDGWDAVITLLTTLEADDVDYFHAVMQGCRRQSNSQPEIDGLDDRLPAPEQHLHELAIERERRRSQQGYATPADARAFLEMARQPGHRPSGAPGGQPIERRAIVTAYFRAVDAPTESSPETVRPPHRALASSYSSSTSDDPPSIDEVLELLAEAGLMPGHPRAVLESGDADPQPASFTRLTMLMANVRDTDVDAFVTRTRELAFLANTLLAGCSVQSRPFTPQEASDAAAAVCNLGLEYWPTSRSASAGPHDLVTMFELGWSVLHRDVSLFVADQLFRMLHDLHYVDPDLQQRLYRLRRTLQRERNGGTPWRARDAAHVLSMLDVTTWVSVAGLLDECPVLPAAMRAILDGRATTVSPTAFEFISTAAQIRDVWRFMEKVPALLA